jgi:uncharacterized membrane protein YphA (DoxX/SURF4 family)
MNHLLEVAQAISAAGFLGYGLACLVTRRMRDEFARYQVPKLRVVTGALQIAAGIGLVVGYAYPVSALLASLGLSLMMLVALWVRLKIKDPFAGFLQAFVCLLINLYVFQGYLNQLLYKGTDAGR